MDQRMRWVVRLDGQRFYLMSIAIWQLTCHVVQQAASFAPMLSRRAGSRTCRPEIPLREQRVLLFLTLCMLAYPAKLPAAQPQPLWRHQLIS